MAKANPSKAIATQPASNPLALLTRPKESPLVPLQNLGGGSSPYVMFSHTQSPQYPNIVQAMGRAVKDGEVIFVNGAEYSKLDPFEFIFTDIYFQYYAEVTSNGDIVKCAMAPVERIPRKADGGLFQECIDAIILVIEDSQVYPARCSFRGAKTPGAKAAVTARLEAELPDWPGRSKDHKIASTSKLPHWAWNTHTANLTDREPKKTDKGQKTYQELSTIAKPTTPAVFHDLNTKIKTKEFTDTLEACVKDINTRREELEAIAAKTAAE